MNATAEPKKWAHRLGGLVLLANDSTIVQVDRACARLHLDRETLLEPFEHVESFYIGQLRVTHDVARDRLIMREETPAAPPKPAPPAPQPEAAAAPLPKIAPQPPGGPSGPRGSAPAAQSPKIPARPPIAAPVAPPVPRGFDPDQVGDEARVHQESMRQLGLPAPTATASAQHVLQQGAGGKTLDPAAVAVEAQIFQSRMKQRGLTVTTSEAVARVLAERGLTTKEER
jgi:hypothetical protein